MPITCLLKLNVASKEQSHTYLNTSTHLHLYPHLFLLSHPHECTTFVPQALFYFHYGANFWSGALAFMALGVTAHLHQLLEESSTHVALIKRR